MKTCCVCWCWAGGAWNQKSSLGKGTDREDLAGAASRKERISGRSRNQPWRPLQRWGQVAAGDSASVGFQLSDRRGRWLSLNERIRGEQVKDVRGSFPRRETWWWEKIAGQELKTWPKQDAALVSERWTYCKHNGKNQNWIYRRREDDWRAEVLVERKAGRANLKPDYSFQRK